LFASRFCECDVARPKRIELTLLEFLEIEQRVVCALRGANQLIELDV